MSFIGTMAHDKATTAASTAALQLGPYYFLCDGPTLARASYGTIHIHMLVSARVWRDKQIAVLL